MQVPPWAESCTPGRESDSTKSLPPSAVLPWGSEDNKKPHACTNRQHPTTLKAHMRLCTPNHGWCWMEVEHWPLSPASPGRQWHPVLSAIDFPPSCRWHVPSLETSFPSHKPSPTWVSLSLESCKQSIIQNFLSSHCSKSLPPRAPSLSTDRLLQKEGCGGTASISSWLRPRAKKQWKGTQISGVPSPGIWHFALNQTRNTQPV